MIKFVQSEEKNDLNELKKKKLKIAVIGSGISGLSAAWLLSKKHKVTIYEKNAELGGHANTVKINYPIKKNKVISINVDTGFIVYNNKNYPNLVNFFKHHNVDTIDSNMSLSISCNNASYEYSGSGLNGIFGQRKNIFKLRQWKLLYDIFKFKKLATNYIKKNDYTQTTIKEWLFKNRFSDSFINYYIIPITSAVWSCSNKDALLFPAQTFLYFFYHHGLLNIKNRPKWRTVKNGSRQYVEKVIKNSNINYKTNVNIKSIESQDKLVYIEINNLKIKYDHVIMACHADQSIQIIKNIDQKVFNVLNMFKFSKNIITLHSCDKYMPKIKSLWSSWNYFSNNKPSNKKSDEPVQMTYWMNLLQNINKNLPLFITLNAFKNSIEAKYIFKEIYYEHPILDNGALIGQSQLETIQGKGNIWHTGAWMRYGFHEDGIISGLKIAEKFGCKCPWPIKYNHDKKVL